MLDPDPELLDPDPELLEPEWSSEPPSSSDGDGVVEGDPEDSSSRDGLSDADDGVDDPVVDGATVGCTTLPTSPASASAPTVRTIAAANPPMPSTTMPTTRFMAPTVPARPLRLG